MKEKKICYSLFQDAKSEPNATTCFLQTKFLVHFFTFAIIQISRSHKSSPHSMIR